MLKGKMLLSVVFVLFLSPQVYASQGTNDQTVEEASYNCQDMRCKKQLRKLKSYAKYGSHIAQIIVAVSYLNGDGLPKNPEKAIVMFRKASSGGSGRAAWMLSYFHKEGLHVEQDNDLAEHYLDLAVERGFKDALFDKAVSILDLTNTNDNSMALDLLFRAEEKQSFHAQYLIAKLYETGSVLPIDLLEAAKRYSFLAQKGFRDSEQRLLNTMELAKGSVDLQAYEKIKLLNKDIEVITVTGSKFTYLNKLAYIVTALDNSSLYNKSVVSRIPGKSCENSSSSCVYIDDPVRWLRGF